jgi:hypothetical protein
MSTRPTFSAPGGWTVHDEGSRMRVHQHGRWRGGVIPSFPRDDPADLSGPWVVVRSEDDGREMRAAANLPDALAALGVPVFLLE